MKEKPRVFSEKGKELFFDGEGNLITEKDKLTRIEIAIIIVLSVSISTLTYVFFN